MNHVKLLTSPAILEEVLVTLRSQGLMPQSLRLIGLLGVGNNASVFSATIDGVHHILKVYASKARMQRELAQLRRITPPERELFVCDDHIEGFEFHFFIVEMPPGRQFVSANLTRPRTQAIAEQLVWLHRVRFRQKVSVPSLKRRLRECRMALEQIPGLGLDVAEFEMLFGRLEQLLAEQAPAFAVAKSRIHGDLWWPNIVATSTDAYLIDWDEVRRADPAEDLAKLRMELWFSKNAFPSRNFFWSNPDDGEAVAGLVSAAVEAHRAEFGDGIVTRLQFYLPLYGLYQLALLAVGGSTTEPVLRPSLYRLLAEDILSVAADPLAPPPDLVGTDYYELVVRSRTERLDGLPPAPDQIGLADMLP